jgi:hypothetical protein
MVTWGLIIFGALALGAGIFRLANSKQPANPISASQEEPNNTGRQLQAERESRVALERQLAETRKELEDSKQQLNAARQGPQPSPSAPQPNTERVVVDVTPEYLMGLYENMTIVQGDASASIYIDKLIRFHGSVNNVSQFRDGSVRVYSNLSGKLITMEFEGRDVSTVSTYTIGRSIDVLGQIAKVTRMELTLLKCSLLESSK